jgi:hypothetical protein
MKRRTIKEELSEQRVWMIPFLLFMVFPCVVINYFSTSKWFCSFWDWHKESIDFDYENNVGYCRRCGKKIEYRGNSLRQVRDEKYIKNKIRSEKLKVIV